MIQNHKPLLKAHTNKLLSINHKLLIIIKNIFKLSENKINHLIMIPNDNLAETQIQVLKPDIKIMVLHKQTSVIMFINISQDKGITYLNQIITLPKDKTKLLHIHKSMVLKILILNKVLI